jgi:hypothetical protein
MNNISVLRCTGINFFRYLKNRGISRETNLIVLSSKNNYSFNEKDLKDVRILINLKKLNLIKHLDMFLNTLVRILPPNTSFIGYFSDNKTPKWHGFHFRRFIKSFKRIKIFSNSKTDYIMNRNEVLELLERNGFKTIDMKEMNGLTYFISLNINPPFNTAQL